MSVDVRLVRIDDRLIHGQVATTWSKQMGIDRILVISDVAANNQLRKLLLKQAAPAGIRVNVISVARMIEVYQSDILQYEKVALLFTSPHDVEILVRKGMVLSSINIGGMSFSSGKRMLTNFVSIDEQDVASFVYLAEQGIELEIRKVPADHKIDLMEALKKQNFL
ncbi:PTS system mannose/fructose/N-acetylgalactosamine-transporter subunit IIB [Vagococcus hydrophili]|uniref:PTS transporter subunit IIB n=1 Tax=Vagococcus hydrophili TaxID=2714947 RepID=A0A6G8AQU5_9ENTE|nr:PTS sugar transporter subunit IIB [Vagococcus hydrophili]QIL47312.1 PTS transporter subunit IIB [Vagococcus hydrophili]